MSTPIVLKKQKCGHRKVCRDIESLACSSDFNTANFGRIEYVDARSRKQRAYEITKDGFSFLVMGYTGAKAAQFKEKFINEFNKRDALLKDDDYIINRAMSVLSERTRALEQRIQHQTKQLEYQQEELQLAEPKCKYYDSVLQSTNTISTTQIAKELDTTAAILNKFLHQQGVIFKSQDTWVLYSDYQGQYLTKTRTYQYENNKGEYICKIHTYWTQKGRKLIHELWNKSRVMEEAVDA